MSTTSTPSRFRAALGGLKYRLKNLVREWRNGPDRHFPFDLRIIGPMVRTAYYNPKPVGLRTRVMLTERVVEYPSVFQLLPAAPSTILDVGSGDSPLPYQMASLGHTVHAVDVLPYPLQHPNLHHRQCDALHLPFDSNTFPFATAISALEHFGLGGYGDPVAPDAPFAAKDEIVRVLAPGGRLLASFPVGLAMDRAAIGANYVVFTRPLLDRFVRGTGVVEERYYRLSGPHWLPCTAEEALGVDSYTHGAAAVVLLLLEKPAKGRRTKR